MPEYNMLGHKMLGKKMMGHKMLGDVRRLGDGKQDDGRNKIKEIT